MSSRTDRPAADELETSPLAPRAPRGAPLASRGPWLVVIAAMTTVVVGVAAYFVGQRAKTPAEIAALARPPAPSLLTARVQLTHARTSVVLRGTLTEGAAIPIGAPTGPPGGLPIVSLMATRRGSTVYDGALIGAVAGRPVIVLEGRVPAYLDMAYGSSGVEVEELQHNLAALGLSIGADTPGTYGAGTALAVAGLYSRVGFRPLTTTVQLPRSGDKKTTPRTRTYAMVPRGEIAFVPALPAQVVSTASLGQSLASGRALAKLGAGQLAFRVTSNTNDARLLKLGARGRAVSDLSSKWFTVRLTQKGVPRQGKGFATSPGVRLTFRPVDSRAAAPFIGQNMLLRIRIGGGGLQWVVPVAAVVTDAAGQSTVTLLRHRREIRARVRPVLAYNGHEIVRPVNRDLTKGELVVVGSG